MKILYINTLYAPNLGGGAERVLQTQVEAMQRAGHETAVLTISSEPGLHHEHINNIPVWRAGIKNIYFHYDEMSKKKAGALAHALWHFIDVYNPLMASYIHKVVREFRPDVASVSNLAGWSISAWDALTADRVPIVQVLHDQYLLCPTSVMYRNGHRCERPCTSCRVMRFAHQRKSSQIDTVVGVSRFIHDKLIAHGFFKGVRRTTIIPNIWDQSIENIPKQPRTEDGTMVFGFIGRLNFSKGIEFLLESFTKSKERNWKLLIAGTGEAQYEAFLKRKFQDKQIVFLGEVSSTSFFAQVDVTVIPSLLEEAGPMVTYESLLSGRPVLGSNSGGIPELVTPGNGRLFSTGDAAELQRGLQQMAEQQAIYRARFNTIQQDAAHYRDRDWWVREWSLVYASALRCHPG